MKKLKLFFACLLMAVLSIGQVWAAAYVAPYLDGTAGSNVNITSSNYTTGSAGQFSWTATNASQTSSQWRLAENGSIAFTANIGYSISKVEITSTDAYPGTWSATAGTVSSKTISGINASSVTISTTTAARIQNVKVYAVTASTKPTVSLDPDGGNFIESVEVTMTPSTGATAYYTTDATKKTTPSTTTWTAYNGSAKPTFTETTTIWVAAVKDDTWSDVVEKTFTKVTPVTSYDIDFETNDLSLYVNWDFTNIGIRSTIARHGGDYYGANVNSGGNGTATCSITTKSKIAAPGTLTFYISKESGNTTASSWKAEVSSDGSDWTEVETFDAKSMSSGTWNECIADLSAYSDVYVRISYGSSSAIRTIDDISLVMASGIAKPTITGEDNFLTSTEVTMSCTTDGAAIYYTTTESAKATPATSGDWNAYDNSNKPSFSATTTVWAAAKKNDAWSAVAEKTFTKATILTVAEALTIIEGLDNKTATTAEYYVSGVVSTVTALTVDGTGEYYISADGTKTSELQVYKGKWVGGANFTSTDQLIEGDDVTIKGKLKKYNDYKELDQNNEVVLYKLKARLAWSEESYEADLSSSNTYPSLTNTNGVTVAYSSSNTDAATIDPATGEITLVAIGSTNITATFTGNETYKANEVSYTLNVSNSVIRADISFEENGGSDVVDLTDQSNLPDPLPTITKAGYNFGGWWTTSDFQDGTEAVAGDAVTSTDPITLYAKWLNPYTVTEALTMIDALADNGETGNVYVSGIVCTAPSNLISGGYLTYYISVDGTETNRLQVYKGKDENNVAFTDKDDVQKDDQVVVYGPLMKYVSGTTTKPEFNTGNYLYSLSRKQDANLEWSAIAFDAFIGQSNTFPTLSKPDGVTIVYSSSNSTAATIDEYTGAITLGTTPNVSTTITATLSGDATYKDDVATYTLNVYNPTNPGTITYEENGGSEVADVTTLVDNFPDPLPTPTKENNIFAGWWTTSTFNDGTQAVAGAPMDGNVILYAKWTEIPVWAYTYTSNVTIASNEEKQVTIDGVDYAAAKTNKGTSATITLPQGVTTLHLHLVAWKSEAQTVTVSGDCFNEEKNLTILANDAVSGTVAKYDLGESGVDYYFSLTPDKEVAANTVITIAAEGQKRFVLFGVNQEGGVLPVLESIEIKGDLTTKTGYKAGDALDLEGLTVEATYSLGGVAQTPVGITNDPELALTYDPLVENQTEVTITATYKGQTDDITITGLDPVASADPKIYVSTLNVNFASVEVGESVPAAETVTVTLTNVASVTATLGGTNADAFSVSPASLIESGDITISILASTDAAASYAATLTISDGEGGADDKTVNLSFAVTEPVVEDDVTGTWTLVTNATTLAAGKKVIIAQYVEADGAINTMAGQASNNRSVIASTVAGATLTPTVGTKVMTLADAGEGHFYLKTSDGEYLYNASGTKSYLRTKATSDDASWTIAVTAEGVATITSVENTNRINMRYNPNTSGNPLFNCYASGQEDIALYMLEEDTPEPTPDYTRNVTIGNYGTICLPKAGTIEGASIFEIAYYGEASKTIFVDEITSGHMSAGVPYIFQATAAQLKVTYDDKTDVDVAASDANGLYGFYNLSNMATDEADKLDLDKDQGNYILYNNQYWLVSGRDAFIYNFRAYIKLSEIDLKEPALAPGRRRVAMAVNGENAAQGFENIESGDKPMKVMIEGTMYILRGEKVYDATGRLVK